MEQSEMYCRSILSIIADAFLGVLAEKNDRRSGIATAESVEAYIKRHPDLSCELAIACFREQLQAAKGWTEEYYPLDLDQ